ncbi:8869_t:CDS:2 [Cetraspora pellucida]|uniref:8869_t:CDS:1 n=1 Tax=Cetraspora pellucida TaxID=1433469 RepID=A0A9N9FC79_9GLOM|nr:8869_t:CDS:2 [Cetraspora pellucida]
MSMVINSLLEEDQHLLERKSNQQLESEEFRQDVQDEFEFIHTEVKRYYPDALKVGKLYKKSRFLKRYNERYFVFYNGILIYYKDRYSFKRIEIESTSEVIRVDKYRFEIQIPFKTYKLQASSENDQAEWITGQKIITGHLLALTHVATNSTISPIISSFCTKPKPDVDI